MVTRRRVEKKIRRARDSRSRRVKAKGSEARRVRALNLTKRGARDAERCLSGPFCLNQTLTGHQITAARSAGALTHVPVQTLRSSDGQIAGRQPPQALASPSRVPASPTSHLSHPRHILAASSLLLRTNSLSLPRFLPSQSVHLGNFCSSPAHPSIAARSRIQRLNFAIR